MPRKTLALSTVWQRLAGYKWTMHMRTYLVQVLAVICNIVHYPVYVSSLPWFHAIKEVLRLAPIELHCLPKFVSYALA